MPRASTSQRWILASLVSIGLHALASLIFFVDVPMPSTGFEFAVPVDVEFGLAEAVEAAAPPAPSAPEEVPPEPEPSPEVAVTPTPPRPRRPRRPRPEPLPEAAPVIGSGDSPVAFLPAGGQLAMRIDMNRVRESAVRGDVERLLQVIPDWPILLGASGVEPVRDLTRVLVATPNLDRASLIVAGELTDDAPSTRAVLEHVLGDAPAEDATRMENGLVVARWPTLDDTAREVALLDERHFVVARPDDLPRVIAVALARFAPTPTTVASATPTEGTPTTNEPPAAEGATSPTTTSTEVPTSPGGALVAMRENEVLSFEVEGVANYLRRSPCPHTPSRFRASLVPTDDGGAEVHAEATFADEAEVTASQACLDQLRRTYMENPIVQFVGVGGPLRLVTWSPEPPRLAATTRIDRAELQSVLRFLHGFLADRLRRTRPDLSPPLDPTLGPTPSGASEAPPDPAGPDSTSGTSGAGGTSGADDSTTESGGAPRPAPSAPSSAPSGAETPP